ncbi:MAG: ABC transporter permease [Pseudomonadota bacterium]|nr:ABC transporter permease [Pseudomonadota bacterium]
MTQAQMLIPWIKTDAFCAKHKFLVYNLISRNLKLKYRQSFLGIAWSLLIPMATAAMYYLVFQVIVKISVPRYSAFIIAGVLPWTFFSQTIMDGLESIRANSGLISKVPLPLNVFPLVVTVTNFITFLIALPVILLSNLLTGGTFDWSLILIIFPLICFFLIGYGISLFLSVAFIHFQDLKHLLGLILQVWFYATPIVYSQNLIPTKLSWIVFANPIATPFIIFRDLVMDNRIAPTEYFVTASLWTLAIFFMGLYFFDRQGRKLAEII